MHTWDILCVHVLRKPCRQLCQPHCASCCLFTCLCSDCAVCFPVTSAPPLQGLQDVIGVSVTHPTWQRTRPDSPDDKHTGWAFVAPEDAPLSSSTGGRDADAQQEGQKREFFVYFTCLAYCFCDPAIAYMYVHSADSFCSDG
jgi:hypothetical protein